MLDLPLEYALIKFKGNKLTGKIVPELLDLAEKGIVRFVDIVFIQKEKDGNIRTVELNDLEQDAYEMFVPIGNHVSSLFTEQDLQIAAGKLPKNSAAALLLWENLWTALEQAGWLSPSIFSGVEVRQYWQALLTEKNSSKAAFSVSTEFFIWLSGGISDYPGLNTYTDIPHLADQIAHEHWFAAIASRLSSLARSVSDKDYTKAREIINEMESNSPKSGEVVPDAADTGIEFLASLESDNRIIRTRIGKT